MATIKKRNNKYCVIYNYVTPDGQKKQKWETYNTKEEAKKRKTEIEYKSNLGPFVVPDCKTLKELMEEYIAVYGKDKWALSTYESNVTKINTYIIPLIGDTKLRDINTRFVEQFYQELLVTPAVSKGKSSKTRKEQGKDDEVRLVARSTIRDIHKILRNCFQQAVKWELMDKNPALLATVPKHKQEKREIWTADTLMHALEVCEDDRLRIALNLAFSCSLRMGELLGLTWDCCDVSKEAIETNQAYIYVNKELQRVTKEAIRELDAKDILLIFPEKSKMNATVLVLKTPKTESSVRKVFLPRSVAEMLVEWKRAQEERKEILESEYTDYNLVMAGTFGYPMGDTLIRGALKKLIKEHNLPPIVFHSLRHTSVTYKLKLNGGDVKAVQGDSGHAQVSMVTDVYSHIIDEDRKQNAILFEEAFYAKKNLDPKIHDTANGKMLQVPEGVDAEVLAKVLGNPELTALLTSLARTLEGN